MKTKTARKIETERYMAVYLKPDSTYNQLIAETYDCKNLAQQTARLENHILASATAAGFTLIDFDDFDFATELYSEVINRYGWRSNYGRY